MHEDETLIHRELELGDRLNRRPINMAVDVEAEALDTYSYLRTFWNIVRKRWLSILTVAFVLTTLVSIYSFRVKPVYQATGRVQLDAGTLEFQNANQYNRRRCPARRWR